MAARTWVKFGFAEPDNHFGRTCKLDVAKTAQRADLAGDLAGALDAIRGAAAGYAG